MTLALIFAVLLFAPTASPGVTVATVVTLVQSALEHHTADKSLAKSLHKLTLSERLDLHTVEELESLGAGPESVIALRRLHEMSAAQPEPAAPAFPSPPAPTPEHRVEFVRQVRYNAMEYASRLPNFICTETIHRYTHPERGMVAVPGTPPAWQSRDVLTVKLTYFSNQEKYDLVLVNGRKTKASYESESARGALSEGEFGSMLVEIFTPESLTQFHWDHATHLRKRPTSVYSFRTTADHSQYRIGVDLPSGRHWEVAAGRQGLIYADDETRMITRITAEAESIPASFPVEASADTLDYDRAYVGDRQYLLPLRAELRMRTAVEQFRNVIEFRDFRKFTGEAKISFDEAH